MNTYPVGTYQHAVYAIVSFYFGSGVNETHALETVVNAFTSTYTLTTGLVPDTSMNFAIINQVQLETLRKSGAK